MLITTYVTRTIDIQRTDAKGHTTTCQREVTEEVVKEVPDPEPPADQQRLERERERQRSEDRTTLRDLQNEPTAVASGMIRQLQAGGDPDEPLPITPDMSINEMREVFLDCYPEGGSQVFDTLLATETKRYSWLPSLPREDYKETEAIVARQLFRDLTIIDTLAQTPEGPPDLPLNLTQIRAQVAQDPWFSEEAPAQFERLYEAELRARGVSDESMVLPALRLEAAVAAYEAAAAAAYQELVAAEQTIYWGTAEAGNPEAEALIGLGENRAVNVEREEDEEQTKVLQDELIALGYLDELAVQETNGYGSFGPRTYNALSQLQLDNGVPVTGIIDAATAEALEHPRPRVLFRAQPGLDDDPAQRATALATGPARELSDGSVYQPFEEGYVLITPDGYRYVRDLEGSELETRVRLAPVISTRDAERFHVTQWGETPYFQDDDPTNDAEWQATLAQRAENGTGGSYKTYAPYGSNDCGPASSLMAMIAIGMLPLPDPTDVPEAIDMVRDAAIGHQSDKSQLLGNPDLIRALTAFGADATEVAATLENIDTALDNGHAIIVGTSSPRWLAEVDNINGSSPPGHFMTIVGRTPSGDYVVNDPLAADGPEIVSAEVVRTALGGSWGLIDVGRPEVNE